MAIYHFSAKVISRSAGRSAVAASAYRSGESITDERTGITHDYTRKGGVLHSEIMLPDGGTMPRAALWNAVEKKHKRKDAVTAREFEVALPLELTLTQQRKLVVAYCRSLSNEYRVAVDVGMHAPRVNDYDDEAEDGDNGNTHAHILMSACSVDADGELGTKCVELDPISCAREGMDNCVEVQRVKWQDACNAALKEAGHSERIDHRTLIAQGIKDRAPGVHLGPAAAAIELRGDESDITLRTIAAAQAAQYIKQAKRDAAKELAAAEAELASVRAELDRINADEQVAEAAEAARAAAQAEADAAKAAAAAETARVAQELADAAAEAARIETARAEAQAAALTAAKAADQARTAALKTFNAAADTHQAADAQHQHLLSEQRTAGESLWGTFKFLVKLPALRTAAKAEQAAVAAVRTAERRFAVADKAEIQARAAYAVLVPPVPVPVPVSEVQREQITPIESEQTKVQSEREQITLTYAQQQGQHKAQRYSSGSGQRERIRGEIG